MRCPAHPGEAVAGSEKAAVSAATARYWVASSSFVGPDRKAEEREVARASPDKAGEVPVTGRSGRILYKLFLRTDRRSKKGVESAIAPQVAQKLAFFQCNLMHWGE